MRVEVEVKLLKESFEKNIINTEEQFLKLNTKMDDMLALRYKGMGAFWLAAAFIGTGIVGGLVQLLHYIGLR